MNTLFNKSSPIDAHFHPDGPIPDGYIGCAVGCDNDLQKGRFGTHGIHPWDITEEVKFFPPKQRMVIGEIGLDKQQKHRPYLPQQLRYLTEALEYAQRNNLPVVLHCVKAFHELKDILAKSESLTVYLHGYMGSFQQIEWFLRSVHTVYFGFSGRVVRSPKTKDCFTKIPLENILIETDSAPNPCDLWTNYSNLAKLKNWGLEETVVQIKQNFYQWLVPLIHPANL